MIDTVWLGKAAADVRKQAAAKVRARAGRMVKSPNMEKHLHAAGEPKMDGGKVFAYARGRNV